MRLVTPRCHGAFVIGGLVSLIVSSTAFGCPDGYKCTSPRVAPYCYWITDGQTGTCPYSSEGDAKAWVLQHKQQTQPQCDWQSIQDLSDWTNPPITCFPGNGSACFIPESADKSAALVYGPGKTNYNCVLETNANMHRARLAVCPLGFTPDNATGLCKAPLVDCCTKGGGSSPQASFGDPVVPRSFELVETASDYRGGGPFPVSITRYYRSFGTDLNENYPTVAGGLGFPWRHNYQRKVAVYSAVPTVAWVIRPEDAPHYFDLIGGQWVGRHDYQDRLAETKYGQGNRIGWVYTSPNDETETYNASGQLQQITTRGGLTQTLNYDGSGRLTSVTDAFGRQLTFSYASASLITTITDALGETYSYTYDANANLSSVTMPDGPNKSYSYDETAYGLAGNTVGFLTGIFDETGTRYSSFWYSGTTVNKSAHVGGVYTWIFGAGSNPWTIDPLGVTRTHTFSSTAGYFRPTGVSIACPTCGSVSLAVAYDANGNVASNTDYNNKRVCYAYDLNRNLETARVEGALSSETCSTVLATLPNRADVRKISTQWHSIWRQPVKIAEANRITTTTYNGDGGVYCAPMTALVNGTPIGVPCSKSVQATTDTTGAAGLSATTTGSPRVWSYTYDGYGQVLTATDPNGKTTTYTYYAATDSDLGKRGNIQTITNAAGHVATFTAYDLNGRPLSISDPNGTVTTLAYSPRGWLIARSVGGETATYNYDAIGQLIKVTSPDGSYIQYTYDSSHRLTQLQDGLGNKIVYGLDLAGNRVSEQAYDPTGTLARTQQRVMDNLGQLHQTVGAQ